MKRLAMLALMCSLLPVAASADTIQVQWFPGGNAHIATLRNDAGQVSATFTTFCLEAGETFSPSDTYQYTVDPFVIAGAGSSLPTSGNPAHIILTQGAVELWFAYMGNLFPGLTAADFQNAIWRAQGYTINSSGQPIPLNAQLANLAGMNTAYDPTSYPYNEVDVYNLYDDSGNRQSFLRVPDGGATLMLLGGALMGLGALRRKFRG